MKLLVSHCIFPVPDICKTAEFYQQNLGFRRTDYLDAAEKHICLYRDGVEIILTQSQGQRVIPNRELYGCGGDAYIIAKELQALQEEFASKGIRLIKTLHKTDYNNRELVIEDIDGRHIYFGIKQED